MSVCDHSSSTSLDCSQIVLIPSFIPSFYNLKALTPHHILYEPMRIQTELTSFYLIFHWNLWEHAFTMKVLLSV